MAAFDYQAVDSRGKNKKGVIDKKWNVTSGSKKHIYELARKSYFAV